MPSIVVISAPCTSGPSTQQELTMRLSMTTQQAPQLPLLQPSLAPVSPSTSRSTSSRLWRGSHRNSVTSPLMVDSTWMRCGISVVPRSRYCPFQGAFYQDLGQVTALGDAAAHVVDRPRRLRGDLPRPQERLLARLGALQRSSR